MQKDCSRTNYGQKDRLRRAYLLVSVTRYSYPKQPRLLMRIRLNLRLLWFCALRPLDVLRRYPISPNRSQFIHTKDTIPNTLSVDGGSRTRVLNALLYNVALRLQQFFSQPLFVNTDDDLTCVDSIF